MIAGDALYDRLMAMRSSTIGRFRVRYPNVPEQQLEDLFSGVLELAWNRDTPLEFEVGRQLQKWVNDRMQQAVSNYMRLGEYKAAEWGDASEIVAEHHARGDSPDEIAVIHEDHEVLLEYIAELSEAEQRIALLSLHPESRLSAKQVAAHEGLPYEEAKAILKRLRSKFSYFEAKLVSPASICARRRKDLTAWQRTGQMPFALSFHIKRCPSCAVACNHARQEVVGALMPFLPAGGLPLAGAGLWARLGHHLTPHRLVIKTGRVASKLSRLSSTSGGGAAAAGTKVVVVAAVLGTTTAAAGAVAVVRAATTHHSHAHRSHVTVAAAPRTSATSPAITHFTPQLTAPKTARKPTARRKPARRHSTRKRAVVHTAIAHAPTTLQTTTTTSTPTTSTQTTPAPTTTTAAPTPTSTGTPPAPNSDNTSASPTSGSASTGTTSSSTRSTTSGSTGGSGTVVAPNGTQGTAP